MSEIYLHHATTEVRTWRPRLQGSDIVVFLDHRANQSELAEFEPPGDWRWERPALVTGAGSVLPLEATFLSEF